MHYNADVQRKFIQLLAHNVSEKEDQLLAIVYNSLRKKSGDALITLLHKYKKKDPVFPFIFQGKIWPILLGTATESLIRTLSDFKAENW